MGNPPAARRTGRRSAGGPDRGHGERGGDHGTAPRTPRHVRPPLRLADRREERREERRGRHAGAVRPPPAAPAPVPSAPAPTRRTGTTRPPWRVSDRPRPRDAAPRRLAAPSPGTGRRRSGAGRASAPVNPAPRRSAPPRLRRSRSRTFASRFRGRVRCPRVGDRRGRVNDRAGNPAADRHVPKADGSRRARRANGRSGRARRRPTRAARSPRPPPPDRRPPRRTPAVDSEPGTTEDHFAGASRVQDTGAEGAASTAGAGRRIGTAGNAAPATSRTDVPPDDPGTSCKTQRHPAGCFTFSTTIRRPRNQAFPAFMKETGRPRPGCRSAGRCGCRRCGTAGRRPPRRPPTPRRTPAASGPAVFSQTRAGRGSRGPSRPPENELRGTCRRRCSPSW